MISLDQHLFLWINGFAGRLPVIDEVMKGIANDYLVIVSLCLVLIALWFGTRDLVKREQNQKAVIVALVSLGLASAAVGLCNILFFRPRPFDVVPTNLLLYPPTDSSFPSNSAAVSFAIAFSILYSDRRTGIALVLLACLYGFSRVYVGVHYPLDILGGAAIASAISGGVFLLVKWAEPWPERLLKALRLLYLA